MGMLTARRVSVVRLGLLAVLWGSSFMWIKIGLRGFTPMQLVFLRLLLATGLLLVICWVRGLRLLFGMAVVLAGVGLVRRSTGRPPDPAAALPKVRAAACGDGPGPAGRSSR